MIYWETNLLFYSYCYLLVAISQESLSEISEKSEEMSDFLGKTWELLKEMSEIFEKTWELFCAVSHQRLSTDESL